MKFGTIPVVQAEGKIFAHNIAGMDGRNAFRKGKRITGEDVRALARLGIQSIYAAELEAGDIDENSAARRIAEAAAGAVDASGLRIQGHSEGRANLLVQANGLLVVDPARLEQVNNCGGVTFATLRSYSLVRPGQVAATVKIIPYALSQADLEQTVRAASGTPPLIHLKLFKPRRVGIVYSGSEAARWRVMHSFGPALKRRITALGSEVAVEAFVPWLGGNDEGALGDNLRLLVGSGIEVILLAGETSTMDANDLIPCAVSNAGGQVVCVGAPIEPGNMVMLAYFGEVPLLNVPGCIRSSSPTLVDQILAALLAGERLSRLDIIRMGHGGLMEGRQHGT